MRRLEKSLVISLLTILVTSSQPLYGATIAGTKCSKVGATRVSANLKFTCIKSGQKLIWNKGVNIKSITKSTPAVTPSPSASQSSKPEPTSTNAPSPTPSPTPTTPSATPSTRREKALAEIRKIYEKNAGKNPGASVKYIISSDAPRKFEEMLRDVIPVSARFWADIYTPNNDFPIILGNVNSVSWVQNEMKKFGHNLTDSDMRLIRAQGLNASRGDVRSNERSTITQYVIGDAASENIPNNIYLMRAFVSHEYVHAVAVSILGDRHEGIPGWSDEGSANFFAFAITSLMASDPIYAVKEANRANLRRPYFDGGLVPHSLNKDDLHAAIVLSEKGGGGDGTTCAEPKILCYTAGALMTEILVADYGFEKFVQWWKASKTKNWEVAFEEIYKYQIDQWYEDVAIPYILEESRIAVPEVTAPSSTLSPKKFTTRASRPFIEPGYKSQEALTALRNWETFIAKGTNEPNISYISGPNTDSTLISEVKNYANTTAKFFSSHKEALQPIAFYLANDNDVDWFIGELSKNDFGLSERDKSSIRTGLAQWGDYSGTKSGNGKIRIELAISKSRLPNYSGFYRARNLSGLTVQAIQNSITGGNSQMLPCWATKGALNFFGLASARQIESPDYFVERVNIVGDWYQRRGQYNFKNFTAADWQSFLPKVSGSQNIQCENDAFVNPVGFMFTELMMSQFGIEKIIDWWSLIKTNSDWRANFNQAFGIEIDSWQQQFAIPYMLTQQEKLIIPLWWK